MNCKPGFLRWRWGDLSRRIADALAVFVLADPGPHPALETVRVVAHRSAAGVNAPVCDTFREPQYDVAAR